MIYPTYHLIPRSPSMPLCTKISFIVTLSSRAAEELSRQMPLAPLNFIALSLPGTEHLHMPETRPNALQSSIYACRRMIKDAPANRKVNMSTIIAETLNRIRWNLTCWIYAERAPGSRCCSASYQDIFVLVEVAMCVSHLIFRFSLSPGC